MESTTEYTITGIESTAYEVDYSSSDTNHTADYTTRNTNLTTSLPELQTSTLTDSVSSWKSSPPVTSQPDGVPVGAIVGAVVAVVVVAGLIAVAVVLIVRYYRNKITSNPPEEDRSRKISRSAPGVVTIRIQEQSDNRPQIHADTFNDPSTSSNEPIYGNQEMVEIVKEQNERKRKISQTASSTSGSRVVSAAGSEKLTLSASSFAIYEKGEENELTESDYPKTRVYATDPSQSHDNKDHIEAGEFQSDGSLASAHYKPSYAQLPDISMFTDAINKQKKGKKKQKIPDSDVSESSGHSYVKRSLSDHQEEIADVVDTDIGQRCSGLSFTVSENNTVEENAYPSITVNQERRRKLAYIPPSFPPPELPGNTDCLPTSKLPGNSEFLPPPSFTGHTAGPVKGYVNVPNHDKDELHLMTQSHPNVKLSEGPNDIFAMEDVQEDPYTKASDIAVVKSKSLNKPELPPKKHSHSGLKLPDSVMPTRYASSESLTRTS